jgi:hypothetical protein
MTTIPGSSDVSSVTNESHQVGNERPISLGGTEAYTAFKIINLLTGFGFVGPQDTSSLVITNNIFSRN